MAEKKRRGRRAYLNDYKPDGKGGYEYRGKLYSFDGGKDAHRAYIRLSLAAAVLTLALTVVPEVLPSVPVSRYPLTAVFWLGTLFTSGLGAYYIWKTAWGGDPIREHIYNKTTARIPLFYLLLACFAFALAAEEIIYLVIAGLAESAVLSLIRPVMACLCGISALVYHLYAKKSSWSAAPLASSMPSGSLRSLETAGEDDKMPTQG